MSGVPRIRLLVLSVVASVAVVALLISPVFGADAEQGVRLHMGSDYQAFHDGSTVQPIAFGNSGCALSSDTNSGPLVALSANPGGKVGSFDLSIGVKSGGSNGTPCSIVGDVETLTIASAPGRPSWRSARFDFEAKGNAWVVVDFFDGQTAVGTFTLLTGSSIDAYNTANGASESPDPTFPYTATSTAADPVTACANPSDSGPDNGPNDNCLWSIQPAGGFDRVRITTLVGSVSLEGSGDFGDDPAHDTVFLYDQAPEAADDSYTTDEDTELSVDAASGVLDNDSDPELDSLSVVSNTDPANGSVVVATDGSFVYTPDGDYFGVDGFDYTVSDGMGGSATAHVTITVDPVNDAPVALGVTKDGSEDTPIEISVGELGYDVEGDPLEIVITSDPEHGTLTLDPVTGDITYTPDPDYFGADTFEYEVCEIATDLCSSEKATVYIGLASVNDAPVSNPDAYEFDENSGTNSVAAATGVLANDSDVESDPMMAVLDVGPSHGTLALGADGSFTYTPDPDYFGPDGFTYHATDGDLDGAVAQVDITVVEVICSDETVVDTDGTVSGAFTLIAPDFQCKRYGVTAYEETRTVEFDLDGGTTLPFRGILQFGGQAAPGGVNSLDLLYDPDGPGPLGYRTMQLCIGPSFDASGNVLAPIPPDPSILPTGETWCLASMTSTADAFGLFVNTYQTYGESDPGFRVG